MNPHDSKAAAVARTLLHVAAIKEATTFLEGRGIPVIVLKGPSLDRWLYEDGEHRTYVDADLLVPKEMLRLAGTALESLGYERLESWRSALSTHAAPFRRQRTGESVDLHHSLGLVDVAVDAWAVLSRRTEELDLDGARITVLDEAGRCLHVSLHAIQSLSGESEKALEDLRRALRAAAPGVWNDASDLARELGCTEWFCAGVSLHCEGRALLNDLGLDFDPALVEIRGSQRGLERVLLQVSTMNRWRDRMKHLWIGATPPPAVIRKRYQTADTSSTLLVVGYLQWCRELLQALPRVLPGLKRRARRTRRSEADRRERTMTPFQAVTLRSQVVLVSVITRVALGVMGFRRVLALAVRVPAVLAPPPDAPPEHWYRFAGQCLGRSIAELVFLRLHGGDDEIVVGVSTESSEFFAHAWLRSRGNPPDFVILRDIEPNTSRPRLSQTVGVADLGDRTVLLTPRGRYVVLAGSALVLLEPFLRGASTAELRDRLCDRYAVGRAQAERDIRALEDELTRAGVLKERWVPGS